MKPLPNTAKELVEELIAANPEPTITTKMTHGEILWAAAQRKFVLDLKARMDAQRERNRVLS